MNRGWRDVPMPERVEALPRSAGGLPVPYVAMWEGEDHETIRECEYAMGARAIYPVEPKLGITKPVFGVMEPSRQRAVVMCVRCQVCSCALPPIDNADTGNGVHWLVDLLTKPTTYTQRLSLEPWVCGECLTYALHVCPGLVMNAPKEVKENVPRNWRLRRVLAVWTANAVAATIAPQGKLEGQPPCIGYVKIEPLLYRRLSAETFLTYGWKEIETMLNNEGPPA